jgi:hypothetical protein
VTLGSVPLAYPTTTFPATTFTVRDPHRGNVPITGVTGFIFNTAYCMTGSATLSLQPGYGGRVFGDGSQLQNIYDSNALHYSDIGTAVLAPNGDGSQLQNLNAYDPTALHASDIGYSVLAPNGDGSSLQNVYDANALHYGDIGYSVLSPYGDGSNLQNVYDANALHYGDIGYSVLSPYGDGSNLQNVYDANALHYSDIGYSVLSPCGDGSQLQNITAGQVGAVSSNGAVADGTYTMGIGPTTNGTITIQDGLIIAVQEAS